MTKKHEESDPYRQDPSDVSFWWRCKCHERNRPEAWSYLALAAWGAPVCPKCGEDMQLEMP
jgi:hypothetical protein